jgi:hypothetical protein
VLQPSLSRSTRLMAVGQTGICCPLIASVSPACPCRPAGCLRQASTMTTPWIEPPPPARVTGGQAIAGTGAIAQDFWSWAMSDLRGNTTRSMLAEYLVARSVGADHRPRVEWDASDVQIPEGRIEVKAAAYLQAWAQRAPSKITFGGLRARTWSPQMGYSLERSYNADCYVFALLVATLHAEYDALNSAGWRFWVLSAGTIKATNQSSLTLGRVRALAGDAVAYPQLGAAIRASLATESASQQQ